MARESKIGSTNTSLHHSRGGKVPHLHYPNPPDIQQTPFMGPIFSERNMESNMAWKPGTGSINTPLNPPRACKPNMDHYDTHMTYPESVPLRANEFNMDIDMKSEPKTIGFFLFKPPKNIRIRILFNEYISQNNPLEYPILNIFLKRRIKLSKYFFHNCDRSEYFFWMLFEKKTLANTSGVTTF